MLFRSLSPLRCIAGLSAGGKALRLAAGLAGALSLSGRTDDLAPACLDHLRPGKGDASVAGPDIRSVSLVQIPEDKKLAEAGCTYDDAAQMIVYLRDPADYEQVRQLYEERFPDKPWVIVHAKVCRPGWLVEMETTAVKAQQTQFAAY